jgi:hypothetical protein
MSVKHTNEKNRRKPAFQNTKSINNMSSLFGMNDKQNGPSVNPSDVLAGFDFSARHKQRAPVTNFEYDGVLVYALPGPTRKTARYDLELNSFIRKNYKGNDRPTFGVIGFNNKQCVVLFDNPTYKADGLLITKSTGIISNKNKVQEIIKLAGCKLPEEEGDELRLYFNLVPILDGVYRLDILATPKA